MHVASLYADTLAAPPYERIGVYRVSRESVSAPVVATSRCRVTPVVIQYFFDRSLSMNRTAEWLTSFALREGGARGVHADDELNCGRSLLEGSDKEKHRNDLPS